MIRRGAAAWATLLGVLLCGCGPTPPPEAPTTASTPTATPSASAAPDLTRPGAAQRIVADLLRAADSDRVIMLEVRRHEASVSVLPPNGATPNTPQTWAYRDGTIKQVPSDLVYVDQATFDPGSFDLSDLGALFRAAASVSGSDENQELQIVDRQVVDHSPQEIMMAVSTMPETRTVFFYPDGKLLPTLDFTTEQGVRRGLADAIGSHSSITSLCVGSAVGAYVDYPGPNGTTARRQRTAKFPVTTNVRNEQPGPGSFSPTLVSADAVWRVLQRLRDQGSYTWGTEWSVIVDDRSKTGTPRMHFTVGPTRFVTDLAGNEVKG